MAIGSSELTDFINAVKTGVLQAQDKDSFELLTPIEFEISVVVKKEGKGGINIAVVGAGGKYEKESTSKIKFSLGSPMSIEQFEKLVKVWQIQSRISNDNLESVSKIIKQNPSS